MKCCCVAAAEPSREKTATVISSSACKDSESHFRSLSVDVHDVRELRVIPICHLNKAAQEASLGVGQKAVAMCSAFAFIHSPRWNTLSLHSFLRSEHDPCTSAQNRRSTEPPLSSPIRRGNNATRKDSDPQALHMEIARTPEPDQAESYLCKFQPYTLVPSGFNPDRFVVSREECRENVRLS